MTAPERDRPLPPTDRTPAGRFPPWAAPLFFLALSVAFLWRSTFAGDVFLPAGLLSHFAPWKGLGDTAHLPPWNPLRWDGIAQFYPWRLLAARAVHAGVIPLWNPYQFCGTPFVANSQSAVFYPGNLLFYLLSDTARAFAWSAALHLTLAGWFTYVLMRRLKCSECASLLAGTIFAFSAWQVGWLQLPTFLATSCWLPLLLAEVYSASQARKLRGCSAARIGLVVSVTLLAGHLQIAFYCLLAASLWTVALTIRRGPRDGLALLLTSVGALAIGFMIAAPQLAPALELSHYSHRVSKPNAAGYATYRELALTTAGLASLTMPDIFGTDSDPDNPYWGFYLKQVPGTEIAVRDNAAETSSYVGILTLLLAIIALCRIGTLRAPNPRVLFFALLAVLTLLMALGSPVDALFYYTVPGFGQTGSPARSLVLWALSAAVLAGFGLDSLLERRLSPREIGATILTLLFIVAGGLALVGSMMSVTVPGMQSVPAFGAVVDRVGADWMRLACFGIAGIGSVALWPIILPAWLRGTSRARTLHGALAVTLIVADLFVAGVGMNPAAPPSSVYPVTPAIAALQHKTGHQRIFPVNRRWSLYAAPFAVLPPNAATVFELRDVQGYDSLLTGQYKQFANRFALPNNQGLIDASPLEVGNMVFLHSLTAPDVPATAALFALCLTPGAAGADAEQRPTSGEETTGDSGMSVYRLPNPVARARFVSADGSQQAPVLWIEDGLGTVSLVVTAPSDGQVALNDQYYPGWHAYVDRVETPIERQPAEPIFRSVHVAAGYHSIQFRYLPTSFKVGLYLALLSILACCALIAASPTFFRRQERGTHRQELAGASGNRAPVTTVDLQPTASTETEG